MGDVIAFRRPKPKPPGGGSILCRNGFHKWAIDKEQVFDVKRGKLVTVVRCERCGKERIESR
ncbi:MAG: hypothetical protein ACFCUJ_08625 [Thiotrichales bacterium]